MEESFARRMPRQKLLHVELILALHNNVGMQSGDSGCTGVIALSHVVLVSKNASGCWMLKPHHVGQL
jgi:hypothetical protein